MNQLLKQKISLVVPMFNESAAIDHFLSQIQLVMNSLKENYEIICVNDGSDDDTLSRLIEFQKNDDKIIVIDLTRNFGKEVALSAGIDHANGDAVIPIDADLQDPPSAIKEMIFKWRQGFDVVVAVRKDRSVDTFLKRNTAALFYSLMERLGEIKIIPNAGDFRLMDKKVVEALKKMPERTRFMKGMFAWVGYKTAVIYIIRQKRVAGSSRWVYWKLWNFAVEGFVSFSTLPLKIWTYIGLLTSLFAMVYMTWIVFRTLIFGIDAPGYASLMVAILFFSGLNMLSLGIVGEYVSRIFIEVKQRPLYLVKNIYDRNKK